MTREEAKELLLHILMTYEPKDQYGDYDDPEPYEQALTMAIEALQTADKVNERYLSLMMKAYSEKPVIVRCKDCRYRELDGEITHFWLCRINERSVDDDDFCAWGERKSDAT